jgi:hypothetical protein
MNEKSSYNLNDSQKEICNNDSDYVREVKNESEYKQNLIDEYDIDKNPENIKNYSYD